jgi:hypothetical protein
MMTVADSLSTGHKAEQPRGGEAVACVNRAAARGAVRRARENPSLSHLLGRSKRGVHMSRRLTSGIESSPMDRRPVDRVAFRVVQPGIHYTPKGLKTLTGDFEGESPPPVNIPWWKRDLTGMTIGQLVVIRYLGDKVDKDGDTKHSLWLVRCHCGTYEHRRGGSLRQLASSADPVADRCWECQNLRRLRGVRDHDSWQNAPIPTASPSPGVSVVFSGGERVGHLTVIGYGRSNGRGALWVVRCDCGLFGLMTTAGLKRGKPPQQCSNCYYAARASVS